MKIRQFIKSIDGLSLNTRRAYEETLWQLDSTIEDDEPTPDEIMTFLKRYETSSLHRHKAAIKDYLEFRGKGWPFTRRQFQAPHRRRPRHIPADAVKAIANAADTKDDQMFVMTLFTLGCRITELLKITRDDITPSGVQVITKGGDERLKRITGDFYKTLSEYARGKKGKVFPNTYSYYYSRLKELATRAGHPQVTPHTLRHARAVDLLEKGMPLPFVQQFLGHASINTTAIYLEITGGELASHLEKADSGGKR